MEDVIALMDSARNFKDEYTQDLLNLAEDNGLWYPEVIGLALLISTDFRSCFDENSVKHCRNRYIQNEDGSMIDEFTSLEQRYVDVLVKSGIHDKYNTRVLQ